MAEQGIHIISRLRRRYVAYRVLSCVLFSVAIALFVFGGLFLFFKPVIWAVPAFFISLFALFKIKKPLSAKNEEIAAFLNRTYPEVEEAAEIILIPSKHLNTLQRLACGRAEKALLGLRVKHKHFRRGFWHSIWVAELALLFVFLCHIAHEIGGHPFTAVPPSDVQQPLPPEKVLPQIDGVELTIIPPAYTHKPSRTQDRFNLIAEEGANAQWLIKTNVALKNAFLLFNDKEHIALKNTNGGTQWQAAKTISQPGFYQVSIDGKLSEPYQVQVIKDAPPVVHVKSPKPYTYIDAGEVPQVNINASLTDDYGISAATIMATVAKGRGEGVKFKEYKLAFNTAFSGQPHYDAQKLVNLPALNMEPGDELYFYVEAKDTHNQQSRTDVFTVAIQDTAELLSMDGVLSGANVKPEFFRSERQIIIDAEQLLKDKDSISVEKFNARSNDLGIDQKLLRLRYGKFLGEEDEVVEGPKGNDGPVDPADFSNAAKILKEYTDDHDKAEDAQFFEPAVKAQLKATLTEMWKAELQLRLYKPKDALPFAYKALRLLKDLQQKSRSYVAKTAYNPTPIKLEKRLTGELDKVIQPTAKQEMKPAPEPYQALKNAINVLEQLKQNPKLTEADKRILQAANGQLSLRASAQPGSYVAALGAMRRILAAQTADLKDIATVEAAIQKTISAPGAKPSAQGQSADMGLSRSYFKNLKQAKP
ncbi:DUF4175 family protein [Mucilaginibacter pedocola]|uniref:Tryptophan-rich sensory protein n=1 Tax=Mucilaginibacter pedocola TaxID=1792845 RepID=A0A1S9PEX5_9SPHI|nr:DUF4175 family protein [Mucilaginibacter pedocola]OOQ59168.1 hypothetical protein BC343_28825 [Mucilaginibacter pedocola]